MKLPASASREERRIVTVLFVDMVGFTELAGRLDPEVVRALQTEYFIAVDEVIHRWDGVVEKHVGDAVMAVFGAPHSDGYDAYRAVRAGMQLPETVSGLRRPDGRPVRVRVGIATEEALVDLEAATDGGATDGGQRLVSGDVVKTAARLQACTAEGTVTVTSATQRATRTLVRYQRLEPATLVGKPEPVEIWRPVDAPAAYPADDVPLVGRAAELATVAEHVSRAARTGVPQVVSVVGPAGVGKSRLVRELSRYPGIGVADGVRWRVGRCLPAMGHDDALAELVRRGEGLAADRRPTVVVIEDLHWMDAAVAGFVHGLVSVAAARRLPVTVLLTARGDVTDRADWADRADCRVSLGALSATETVELLRHLADRAGRPAALVRHLLPLVCGNPMYAEAYLQLVTDRGTSGRPGIAMPIPEPVRAAVSARLDQLGVGDRTAALAASVLGRTVPADALAFLLGTTDDEAYATLRRLARAGLLVPRPTGLEYTFPDPAVRAVAYARLPHGVRVEHHRRAAVWLDALPGARRPTVARERARHWQAVLDLSRVLHRDATPYLQAAWRAIADTTRNDSSRLARPRPASSRPGRPARTAVTTAPIDIDAGVPGFVAAARRSVRHRLRPPRSPPAPGFAPKRNGCLAGDVG